MRVIATADVPASALARFAQELRGEFHGELNDSRVTQLSLDPPSWVNLIGRLEWWQVPLAGIAAVYVAELAKEAAKSTWKVSAITVSKAVGLATRLAKLAKAMLTLKRDLGNNSEIMVSLPEPNEYFGARLVLSSDDANVLQAELALFIAHLPALSALIEEHKSAGTPPATGYFLSIDRDMDMGVAWIDGKTLQRHEALLKLHQ